jgi:dTDP-4-amino-4,6-dideoxygalactose transaminase
MEFDLSTNRKLDIPMSAPDLTDEERAAVMEVLGTNRLSMGPQTSAFEAAAASLVGVKHGVAVSSGTAGLHLCIRAAGVQDGDWVITTPFSFVATGNVMLYERAVPIFIDVDPVSGNLDAELAKKAAADLVDGGSAAERWMPRKGSHGEGKLKAIIPVDVFGQPANYDVLQEIAETHDLALIEDSCEAIGAEFNGQKAGSFGDAGIFAFYPNKQITTGEGGVIVTDRDDWAEKIRALRNQGRAPGDTWLDHTYLGYNYRMDEMSAAMGGVQLTRLDELLEKRAIVASLYAEGLKGMAGVETPVLLPSTSRMSWFVYVIRLDQGVDRARVIHRLSERGVPSRPYFSPIHLQPFYREQFGYREGDFPVTEDLGKRSLSIPFSGVMTPNQVEYVCGVLREVLANT